MPKVDFYILKDRTGFAQEKFACRLTEKAYHLNHKIYINTATAQAATRLNDLLWTYRDGSFIPHELVEQYTGQAAVVIGFAANPNLNFDVLINLHPEIPEFFTQYQRVAEIISGEDNDVICGRQRFKYYRQHGCELSSHQIPSTDGN